jgi:hypothetical protein
MKIKKLQINQEIMPIILSATLIVGAATTTTLYYKYENIKQVCETDMDDTKIYRNELGEICCYFDVGEHIIEISKNVAYNYKTEEIEGYMIKKVEINGWKNNNKITYINTKPVIVVATNERKDKLEFNNFGIVLNEQNKTKIR